MKTTRHTGADRHLADAALWALGFLDGADPEHCSQLDLRHILRRVRDRLAAAADTPDQPPSLTE